MDYVSHGLQHPNGLSAVHSSVDQRFMRQRPLHEWNSRYLAVGMRGLPDEEPRRYKNGQLLLQPLSSLTKDKRDRLSLHGDGVAPAQNYGLASSSMTSMSHAQRLQIAQLQRMYQSRQGSLPPEPSLRLARKGKARRKNSLERDGSDSIRNSYNRTSLVLEQSASPELQPRGGYN